MNENEKNLVIKKCLDHLRDQVPIFIFGFVGGGTSLLISLSRYEPILNGVISSSASPQHSLSAWIIATIVGAISAFIGVNLFPGYSRDTHVRACAFALLCGLSWQDLGEAGAAYLKHKMDGRLDRRAIAIAGAAELSANRLEKTAETSDAIATTELITTALYDSNKTTNQAVKSSVLSAAQNGVTKMVQAASKNPDPTILDGIVRISKVAADNGEYWLARDIIRRVAGNPVRDMGYAQSLERAVATSELRISHQELFHFATASVGQLMTDELKKNPPERTVSTLEATIQSLKQAKSYFESTNDPGSATWTAEQIRVLSDMSGRTP